GGLALYRGQGHDRPLGGEQPAVEIPLPGRLAVARTVGHRSDAQSRAVHHPAQLLGELPHLRVEFVRQGPPPGHRTPLPPPSPPLATLDPMYRRFGTHTRTVNVSTRRAHRGRRRPLPRRP